MPTARSICFCFSTLPLHVLTIALLRYEKPEDWSIVTVPLPELRDSDVLVQVKACGVCGTGQSPSLPCASFFG